MSPNETNFVPLTDAVSATLGSSYNELAHQLLSPSDGNRGKNSLSELHNLIFSSSTLDGSIITTRNNPKPGLISNLAESLNRPLRAHHPNLQSRRENMPDPVTNNVLNAHLTGQLPTSLLNDDTRVHLPTLLAVMGRNADVVRKTDLNPDLILSSYYHILCGYLTAYNTTQNLVVSLEDLGRLSVLRIKDLETPHSQGFTISVFPTDAPDDWSSILSYRARYQRAKIITKDGVLGFNRNNDVYSATAGMEHSPGTIDWYLVFLSRLIRFFADYDLPAEQVDYTSLERHKPNGNTQLVNIEAARYVTANLTVASTYNPSLTNELIRATKLTPHLKKNTISETRRSLLNTDHNLYGSRHSRQHSLVNDQLVESFTRFTPARLLSLRQAARTRSNHSRIMMHSIIAPYQKDRSENRFRYLAAQGSLAFLRHSLMADIPSTHDNLDRVNQVFIDLHSGADPTEI